MISESPFCDHLQVFIRRGEPPVGGPNSAIQFVTSPNGKYQLDLRGKEFVVRDLENGGLTVRSQPFFEGIQITTEGEIKVSPLSTFNKILA